ncbi:MAG: carboxypeptidase-like regulatory domain-containing protein [Candidatus Sulfotelmatobacter sp.]
MRSADGRSVRLQIRPTHACVTLGRLASCLIIFLAVWAIGTQQISAQNASAQNPELDNQSNMVRGTVVNVVTRQPVGRALVYSLDNRYATFTDGEGHFEFTLPKAAADNGGVTFSGNSGSLTWLTARRPGFLEDLSGNRPVEVSAGTEVTIALMPEALIKGRVTLPAADPAPGISVELFSRQVQDGTPRWMQKSSTRTNSNGEFRFAELEPGSYKLLTREWMDIDPEGTVPGGQRYGFPPVYYPSASDFATASTIQLTAGQSFEADMSLVRQPYYRVTIPVTNTERNHGVSVTVSSQGDRGPGYSLGYNGSRHLIEGQLPNGKYLVEAASFDPNFSASGSVNLMVAGAPAEGPMMVLARNSSIPVNVKEEFTSPAGNIQAFFSTGGRTVQMHGPRVDVNINAEAIDDFKGRRSGTLRPPTGTNEDPLILENLAPGSYWLRLAASRGYVASASMGGTDLLREPMVVLPGASTPIEITMRDDTAELEGSLLGVAVTPVNASRPGTQSFLYCIPMPDTSGRLLELSVSSDGKFDVQGVAPGVYRVIAFNRQQRDIPYRDPEAMKAYESKGQVVHFAPGQKVTLQLQVVPGNE